MPLTNKNGIFTNKSYSLDTQISKVYEYLIRVHTTHTKLIKYHLKYTKKKTKRKEKKILQKFCLWFVVITKVNVEIK